MSTKKKSNTTVRAKIKKVAPKNIAATMINKWNSFKTKTPFSVVLAEKTAAWEKNS